MKHLIYDQEFHSLATPDGRQLAIFCSDVTATEAESMVRSNQIQPPQDPPPPDHFLGSGVADSLPDKPSDLIQTALECLHVIESDDRIRIRMTSYHKGGLGGSTMGLAGAVMHFRLRADIRQDYTPNDYCASLKRKLRFLHIIATGRVHDALQAMHLEPPPSNKHRRQIHRRTHVPNYAIDREGFRRSLSDLARELKRHSL